MTGVQTCALPISTAGISHSYDKSSNLKFLKIIYYDSKGKKIRKASTSEVSDFSNQDYNTIATDIRFKTYGATVYKYPFTIEYQYEMFDNSSLGLAQFTPYFDERVTVENASCTAFYNTKFKVNYKGYNLNNFTNNILIKGNKCKLEWKLKNYIPYKEDIYMPEIQDFAPCIYLQPQNIKFGKYRGLADNWSSLGDFFFSITKQKNTLTKKTIQDIHEITLNINDNNEKIKRIYEYMQSKTRYVNIKLGLGGLKPQNSLFVDKTGWGDCKALTNYTQTLLKEIGIESFYTIIRAGNYTSKIIDELPSSIFNHVILCVPNNNDTIWLECTNQTNPMGFISDFTDNRYCLILKEKGSYLTKTPKYDALTNLELNKTLIDLQKPDSCILETNSTFSGNNYSFFDGLNQINDENKIKYLGNIFKIPSFNIIKFKLDLIKNKVPIAKLYSKLAIQQIGSNKNGKIVFNASLMNRNSYSFTEQIRSFDIYIRHNKEIIDSLTYLLPKNYYVQTLPETVKIINAFGSYNISCENFDNKILYVRHFILYAGKYSYEAYPEFKNFLSETEKNDNQKIIIKIKSTN